VKEGFRDCSKYRTRRIWCCQRTDGRTPPARSSLHASAGPGCDGPAAEEEAPADPDESADRSEFAAAGEDAIPSARGGADCGPAAASSDWLEEAPADGGAMEALGATPSLRPACERRQLASVKCRRHKHRQVAVMMLVCSLMPPKAIVSSCTATLVNDAMPVCSSAEKGTLANDIMNRDNGCELHDGCAACHLGECWMGQRTVGVAAGQAAGAVIRQGAPAAADPREPAAEHGLSQQRPRRQPSARDAAVSQRASYGPFGEGGGGGVKAG